MTTHGQNLMSADSRVVGVNTPVSEQVEQEGRWFGPGVAGIGAASFFADVGHEIPTALLPSLITSTLGGSASTLGLIEGVSDALAGVARLGGGALADDPHRRRSIAVGGYATTAVLGAATGVVSTPLQVGLLRAGAWTARGLRVPARNALLADIVPPKFYGRAYGFERSMDNLGAIVGPLLAIGLVAAFGTRWAIGLSVFPGLLAAVAIIYAIRHTAAPSTREHQPIRLRVRPVLQGALGRLMIGITAFEFGNCAATLLILRATDLFKPGRSSDRATQLALGLYVAYNLAATLISVPAGRHSDRHGATRVLAGGALAFAAGYAWFAAGPDGVLALAPAFVLAGLGIGCAETAEHAAVASLAPAHVRGSAFGFLAAIQSVGNLAASVVAGVLWTAVSPAAAFVFLTAAMTLAAVLIVSTRGQVQSVI